MDVDEPYQVETPSSATMETSGPSFPSGPNPVGGGGDQQQQGQVAYDQPLAIAGPAYQGPTSVVARGNTQVVPSTQQQQQQGQQQQQPGTTAMLPGPQTGVVLSSG